MIRPLTLACAFLLALSACATSEPARPKEEAPQATWQIVPAETQTAEAKKEEQICVYERATGSNLTKLVCRPKSLVERERREAEDVMTRGQLSPRPGGN